MGLKGLENFCLDQFAEMNPIGVYKLNIYGLRIRSDEECLLAQVY